MSISKFEASFSDPFLPLDEVICAQQRLVDAVASEDEDFSRAMADLFDRISSWLAVESVSILLYDGPQDKLRLLLATGILDSVPEELQAPGKHLTGKAYSEGRIITSNDFDSEQVADKKMLAIWGETLPSKSLRSAVFIPFYASLECSGVFRVFNRLSATGEIEADGFTKYDVELLRRYVDYASSLLAVLWERRQFQNLTTLLSLLPTRKDVLDLCNEVARAAASLSNSISAVVYLVEAADIASLRMAGSWGLSQSYQQLKRFPVNDSIAGKAATTGETIQIADLRGEPGVANREVAIQEGWISCAVVPITGTLTKGSIAIFSRSERGYQPSTIDILKTLGLFVGNLLDSRAEAIRTEHLRKVLGHIGHSLRSPLAGISHVAAEIRRRVSDIGGPDGPKDISVFRGLLVDLYRELARADRRIESLLFAKPGIIGLMGLNTQEFSISGLIIECVERHHLAAQKRNIRILVYDSAKRLPTMQGDKEKIDIALDNLLENAIKYSWKGESVEVRGWHSGREVRVSVTDRGLGIPETHRKLIFEAFTRSDILDSKRYISGTGLGLELVRSIVEAHGGSVEVESEPFLNDPRRRRLMDGFETTFTIRLPIRRT